MPAKARAEELAKHTSLTRYTSFHGREKRIAMLSDERAALLQKAESLRKGADLAWNDSQQKEIDWAVQGGIASGIAGGAAGVSAAVDAQVKNAQIRAQNEANMKAIAPAYFNALSVCGELKKQADALLTTINDSKIKLVAETPKEQVLSKLTIRKTDVTISPTGAFTVKTTLKAAHPVVIFDNVSAVIDGTLSADLYQKGEKVGSALMVVPLWGISEKEETLEGICLSGAKENVPFEVKFTPHDLWEIEK